MKRFIFLLIMASIFACTSSNDEPGEMDDTGDDMGGGPVSGEGATEVNFSIAVLTENDSEEYMLYDINANGNIVATTNLNQAFGFQGRPKYNVDNGYLMLFKDFNEAISWRRNLKTGLNQTFTNYFISPSNKTGIRNFGDSNYLITFFQDYKGNNGDKWFVRIYDITNGTSSEDVYFADGGPFNPYFSGTRFARDGKFFGLYRDVSDALTMKILDLNSPLTPTVLNVATKRHFTMVDDDIYLFGENEYQIFNCANGSISNSSQTPESIYSSFQIFESSLKGDQLTFPFTYGQPSQYVRGPAIYDLTEGVNILFDLNEFDVAMEGSGQFIQTSTTSINNQTEEVIVLGYNYQNIALEFKHGIAFLNYNMEVIATLEIPFEAVEIMIK